MTLPAPAPTGADTLRKLLEAAQKEAAARLQNAELAYNAAILADDLWHGGKGWNGPLPKADLQNPESVRSARDVQEEVKRTFVRRNLSADVAARHVHGVAGKEPLWSVLPEGVKDREKMTAAQAKQAEEYTSALSTWLEEAGGWQVVQRSLLAAVGIGYGATRLYIHRSKLIEQGGTYQTPSPDALDLTRAAKLLSVMDVDYRAAGTVRDFEGRVTGAYYHYRTEDNQTRTELHERVGGKLRVYPDFRSEDAASVEYPVSDTLIWEMRQKPLITESMRSLQRMLDKVFTMGSRNMDLGGFTERTILNAQMPMTERKVMVDGKEESVMVRAKLYFGSGVTNNFNGLPMERLNPETGKTEIAGLTTPSIIYRDPTSFETFGGAIRAAKEAIYDEAKQLHVLMTGDASASGVSRQQAVNDFLTSLESTKHNLEQMFRWLLGTVLKMALHFMGRGSELEGWRISVQARFSAVQPTPSDVETAIKLQELGAISEEEFASRIGIEDWAAEKQRRSAEGITPAVCMKLLDKGLPTWVHLRALSLAFPALGITKQDVARQREMEMSAGLRADNFDDPEEDVPFQSETRPNGGQNV